MYQQFDLEEYNKKILSLFRRFPSVQNTEFNKAYKPGLEHIENFNKRLGNPIKAYKIIHIAGTNGKGSVSNMLAAVLSSLGFKVGLYTSPHLLDFRERVRILDATKANAKEPSYSSLVSREYVWSFLQDWEKDFEELDLSFFEITTALAFKYFADKKIDIAIIETGLGGRLDSTNIVESILSIITNIGLDHCHLLGNTIQEIAREKAGIIKQGSRVVLGEKEPELLDIFEKYKEGTKCFFYAEDLQSLFDESQRQDILSKMDLQASYQKKNLITVLAALKILEELLPLSFDKTLIRTALINTAKLTDFHGRWEKLCDSPKVICDIGHNPPALKYNFEELTMYLKQNKYKDIIVVFGIMVDKDFNTIKNILPPNFTYIFTKARSDRAKKAELLYQEYLSGQQTKAKQVFIEQNIESSINLALKLASPESLVYIGGSAVVVSEALTFFA